MNDWAVGNADFLSSDFNLMERRNFAGTFFSFFFFFLFLNEREDRFLLVVEFEGCPWKMLTWPTTEPNILVGCSCVKL